MTTIRIDCGGRGDGASFKSDFEKKYFIGEQTFTYDSKTDLENVGDKAQGRVLRSHRYGVGDFRYEIPVNTSGEYEVELWFAEVWEGITDKAQRVFKVQVSGDGPGGSQGTPEDIDVFASVGSKALLSKKYKVKARSKVQIDFYRGEAENPIVSAILVNLKNVGSDGSNTGGEKPVGSYPTAADLSRTKKKIEDYVLKIRNSNVPIRGGHVPYQMFHPASSKPHGTVLCFHGFSGGPYGNRILVKYLYDSGFNVFSAILAGHSYSGDYWPQVNLAEKHGGKDAGRKLREDPVIQKMMREGSSGGRAQFSPDALPELLRRIIEIAPEMRGINPAEYISAIMNDNDPRFDDIFDSTHMQYLVSAQQQLDLLKDLPGEVYTMGLSVGGSVAIAVAAANPGRVTRCFSAAPLLELHEAQPNAARLLINAIGPLGMQDFGWSPENRFPMSNLTAAGRFGGYVTSNENGKHTFANKKCQLFLCLTEMEDAADIITNRRYFEDVGGEDNEHYFYIYERSKRVPHPFIDPTEVSQGTSNRFCKSLYGEVYRFFLKGEVKKDSLDSADTPKGVPEPPAGHFGWHNYKEL